jgi:hypothetical protein
MRVPRVAARRTGAATALLLVLSAGTVAVAPGAAAAGSLYVAKTGCSDSGSGSRWVPFCTIGAAAAAATAGTTVRVRAGTYAE